MTFWDVAFATCVGGLMVLTTVGWCLYIGWKWVCRDVMKDLEKAYEVYLKHSYKIFEEK